MKTVSLLCVAMLTMLCSILTGAPAGGTAAIPVFVVLQGYTLFTMVVYALADDARRRSLPLGSVGVCNFGAAGMAIIIYPPGFMFYAVVPAACAAMGALWLLHFRNTDKPHPAEHAPPAEPSIPPAS